MDFSIREANEKDYEEICELFAELDAFHRVALPDVFQESAEQVRSRKFISDIISDKNAVLFVAETNFQIIGLINIEIRKSPDIPIMVPRKYAVIDAIGVKERFRNSGVGKALMKKAHQWALEKGVNQIELNVWEFNQGAIKFYEKLGYKNASRKMWKNLYKK